jgi:hypothetical protein
VASRYRALPAPSARRPARAAPAAPGGGPAGGSLCAKPLPHLGSYGLPPASALRAPGWAASSEAGRRDSR